MIHGLEEGPDARLRLYGPGMGRRVDRLAGGASDLVFALIERHGIACDTVRGGRIQPAHDERSPRGWAAPPIWTA